MWKRSSATDLSFAIAGRRGVQQLGQHNGTGVVLGSHMEHRLLAGDGSDFATRWEADSVTYLAFAIDRREVHSAGLSTVG